MPSHDNTPHKTPTMRNASSARRKAKAAKAPGARAKRTGFGGAAQHGWRTRSSSGNSRFSPYGQGPATGGFSTLPSSNSPFSQGTRQGGSAAGPSRPAFAPRHGASGGSKGNLSRGSAGAGGNGAGPVFSRRSLLIGAGAVAGVVALGGAGAMASHSFGGEENAVDAISVPESAVTNLDQLEETPFDQHMRLEASYCLPFGSLVWADCDAHAACLIPTGTTTPLNRVALLFFGSGNAPTVMDRPQGADEGFDFMEARASIDGMAWVEANVFEGTWRVFTAQLASDGSLQNVTKVDEGDSTMNIPSLAACKGRAFWQTTPNAEAGSKEPSTVKSAPYGSDDVVTSWHSTRAFATRIAGVDDGVTITPRADASGVYYQLTRLSATDGQMTDQMTMPASMTPTLAGYGRTGFSFGFADIYNYGGGIANLGTYAPIATGTPFDYDGRDWFRFGRTPSANPAWCENWMVVRSTRAIALVNLESKTFFMIEAPSNADSYGEYLASSGQRRTVVGTSLITPPEAANAAGADAADANLVSSDGKHTLVRVFAMQH